MANSSQRPMIQNKTQTSWHPFFHSLINMTYFRLPEPSHHRSMPKPLSTGGVSVELAAWLVLWRKACEVARLVRRRCRRHCSEFKLKHLFHAVNPLGRHQGAKAGLHFILYLITSSNPNKRLSYFKQRHYVCTNKVHGYPNKPSKLIHSSTLHFMQNFHLVDGQIDLQFSL
jgi:hypothetical protein